MRREHKVYRKTEKHGSLRKITELKMDWQLKNKNGYVECVELGRRERNYADKLPLTGDFGLMYVSYHGGDYEVPIRINTPHESQVEKIKKDRKKKKLKKDIISLTSEKLSMIDLAYDISEIEAEIEEKKTELEGLG